jgi:hypothetical protein
LRDRNHTTFSNNAQIAGHVRIDDYVVLGAYSGVHQFGRVGVHAMLAAGAIVLQDVPPFVTAPVIRPSRRHQQRGPAPRGFSADDIMAVRRAYKTLYRQGLSLEDARAASPPPRPKRRCSPAGRIPRRAGTRHRALADEPVPAMPDTLPALPPVTIGIVAGEASGDALAANLIRAVRERAPNTRFVGIAGPKMQAAGCDAWYPLETLSVRGWSRCCTGSRARAHSRRAGEPSARRARAVFIGVDAPDFNLGLERKLKRRGVRTIHYVSPSVWAWRRDRLRASRKASTGCSRSFRSSRRSTKRRASR